MNSIQYSDPVGVNVILKLLKVGEAVALPTETVYGLAAPISNEAALRRIFEIKRRPAGNPVIVHIGTFEQIKNVAQIPKDLEATVEKLTNAFWPGPLTLVLPAHPSVSSIITAGLNTVAVRMPNHPIFLQILQELGEPLAAPSANPSGAPSPTRWEHVVADYKGTVPVVDGGECVVGIESTVIRPLAGEILLLRQGSITVAEIEAVTGLRVVIPERNEELGRSPGTSFKHYSPKTRVKLVFSESELKGALGGVGGCVVLSSAQLELGVPTFVLTQQSLYDALRNADNLELSEILVHCTDDIMENPALMDRLRRAAQG
ncbi:MAG: threonylcarbamoyl-AMP synthase [Ignavibacteria bacterium]|nr:threonylcarbamoyl-AMP synthase [Ignavibacteria bacterium]